MRSWAAGKALAKQRKIRLWKRHNLRHKGPAPSVTAAQHPAFRANSDANQRDQELNDFLNRLRDRR